MPNIGQPKPKPSAGTTPISFPSTLNLVQREEAALLAGWPARLVPEIASISEVEDAGPSTTINSIGAEGLLQILNHPDLDRKYSPILDPVNNFRAGYALYKEQGFAGAWTNWEPPGAYTSFMSSAQSNLPAAEKRVTASGHQYNTSGGANAGGPAQQAQLTSFTGSIANALSNVLPGGAAIQNVANLIADLSTNPVDVLERGALMVGGAILVIIGLIMFMKDSGAGGTAVNAASLAIPEIGEARMAARGRIKPKLSAEQKAAQSQRMALAEKNANLGERKLALKEHREARLSTGKIANRANPKTPVS